MSSMLSLLTLAICFITIISLNYFFGKSGLLTYSAVVTIAANIQVLKLTKYSFFPHEVALGTVIFATIFAVDNILMQYYGEKIAKKSIYLSFAAYLFFVIIMQIAVAHPCVNNVGCTNYANELSIIFSPGIKLFISSVLAYFVGQFCDICLFKMFSKIKGLSIKSFFAMAISAFVDNAVFSALAWIVFSKHSISWNELWNTYIINLYVLRLIVVAMCVPFMKVVEMIGGNRVRKF